MSDNILLSEQRGDVLILTFNHEKEQNPFSDALQQALIAALQAAESDETVNAVVLYGGDGRSFSVGGDFKEVIELGQPAIIAKALNQVVDLYIAILLFSKPLIAALDKYVIGMGFQVAILADYRIGTERTKYIMPELKNGVACTLGSVMTEYLFGRFVMQEICYEGTPLPVEYALQHKLLNVSAAQEHLLEKAVTKAAQYGQFPHKAFRGTKRVNNSRFIEVLEGCRQATIDVHTAVFLHNEHKKHMNNILGR